MNKYIIVVLLLSSLTVFSQPKNKKTKKVQSEKVTEKPVKIEEIQKVELSSDNYLTIEEPGPAVPVYEENENTIYNSAGIEVKPEFPGGYDKLQLYLSKNIVISQEMKNAELKGKVFVSFIVEKDGSITDIKIVRDLGYNTSTEVLRVLKNMPKWLPGENNGKKVRCSFMFPINIDATKQ